MDAARELVREGLQGDDVLARTPPWSCPRRAGVAVAGAVCVALSAVADLRLVVGKPQMPLEVAVGRRQVRNFGLQSAISC